MAPRLKILAAVMLLVTVGLAVAGLGWLVMRSTAAPQVVNDDYQLHWRACTFALPAGVVADCADLLTPETSGRFTLPVAVIRYLGEDKRSDPVMYLQGGPGAGAGIEASGNSLGRSLGDSLEIEAWIAWRDHARIKRDLILIDRRGTGGSQPSWQCDAYERASRQALGQNLSAATEQQQGLAALRRCLKHDIPDFDISHFGTRISAADIRALMVALKPAAWNLVGVSYGTRLALEVAQDAPGLKALVLDSVYPPGRGGLASWPELLADALQQLQPACLADAECAALARPVIDQYGSLGEALTHALQQLKQHPVRLTVSDGEWPLDIIVNDARFLAAVFSGSYSRYGRMQVVTAITAVLEGAGEGADESKSQRQPLRSFIDSFVRQAFASDLNSLTFFAVDCRDNGAGSKSAFEQSLAAAPMLAPYLSTVWETSVCHEWPAQETPLTLPQLTRPAWLLAGQYDPITPASWARELAQAWPKSQLQVIKGGGHSLLSSEPCVLAELGNFLDRPEEQRSGAVCRL